MIPLTVDERVSGLSLFVALTGSSLFFFAAAAAHVNGRRRMQQVVVVEDDTAETTTDEVTVAEPGAAAAAGFEDGLAAEITGLWVGRDVYKWYDENGNGVFYDFCTRSCSSGCGCIDPLTGGVTPPPHQPERFVPPRRELGAAGGQEGLPARRRNRTATTA